MDDKKENVHKEESHVKVDQNEKVNNKNNAPAIVREIKFDQLNAGSAGPSNIHTENILPNTIPYPSQSTIKNNESQINPRLKASHVFTIEELASALSVSTPLVHSNRTLNRVERINTENIHVAKNPFSPPDRRNVAETKITKENPARTLLDLKNITSGIATDGIVINNRVSLVPPIEERVVHIPNQILPPEKKTPLVQPKNIVNSIDPVVPPTNANKKKDFGLISRDSLASIGSNVCRICLTRGRERLISPCNCKGSLASVHLSCLERWLNQVGRNHCELCGFSYPAIRTPRYTVLQALRLWFGNPRNRNHLQSDCLLFWLLSTITAGLLAVCFLGTQYFVVEGNKIGKLPGRRPEGVSHRITEIAMNFFMIIVLCGYTVTVYLLWKDHYVLWNRWRRANVNVRLLLSPRTTPVPFVPRDNNNYTLV